MALDPESYRMSYQIITDPKFPGQFRVVCGVCMYTICVHVCVYVCIYKHFVSRWVGRSVDGAGLVCHRA